MIELKFPLQLNSYGSFASTTSYAEIWKQRVTSALSTLKNTRVMRPDFGVSTDNVLFMNSMGAISSVTGMVEDVFRNYLPDLTLNRVEATNDEDNATIYVDVEFSLPNKQSVTTKVSINADSLTGGY